MSFPYGVSHGFQTPAVKNEPVYSYLPGSAERADLKSELHRQFGDAPFVPSWIAGKAWHGAGRRVSIVCPHDHHHHIGEYAEAGEREALAAVEAARSAFPDWSRTPFEDRARIFLKAAELLAGPHRARMNAATILGQSKNVQQAEIDAACEQVDFLRFNVAFAEQLYAQQPISGPGLWNRVDYRPLEGFVFAVTPFNFTAIAANLAAAPALMGNTVVWKCAPQAVHSAKYVMAMFEAAGLPPGVINLLTGGEAEVGQVILSQPDLAGIHFTGSTGAFRFFQHSVASNSERYRNFVRVVGETGGKDFIIAHPTAEVAALVTAIVRGAFEYQGQKCSAASRIYIPKSLWPEVHEGVRAAIDEIGIGDPADFSMFMGAVIDDAAFQRIKGAIEWARMSPEHRVVAGGWADDRKGWFIGPTLIETVDPFSRLLTDEIFGPVVTAYVYDDDSFAEVLGLCDRTSPYGLTGAIFAREAEVIAEAASALRYSAGNLYINDKCTGAVVGQQPFGGARASGTNDKAGSILNLIRWVSPRTIKEALVPPTDWRYPHMLAP
jgi:1-pyrroline-5-carboxylate dehydrogenase